MKTKIQSSEYWKVVYVAPRSEKKVGNTLTLRGIENFVPIKREKRKWSDRWKWVEMPLISGYVFVKPDAQQRDRVLQVKSVLNYVRYNQADARIQDAEINALKSIQEKGYYVEIASENLKSGDRARIAYGPFKGLTGNVIKQHSETMITLIMDCIDIALRIKVPAEVLIKEKPQ